jgi:hypothetical protein
VGRGMTGGTDGVGCARHWHGLLCVVVVSSSLAYQGFNLSKLRHEARRKVQWSV